MSNLSPTPITVAYGDGIGPEIMEATLRILDAAGAKLDIQTIEIGEKVFERGNSSGIAPEAWDSLLRTRVFLKAPITTPLGGGVKSLNVTVRKTLGLYANVRPCVSYAPYVETKHPGMDLVMVRENEEDLYAGVEYRQTEDVCQAVKLISRPGCERIVRYAFEYALDHNRKQVTCITKDNIMKLTDGLFHRVFNEIAKEYPQIKNDHLIVDIGAARIADTPEMFDVIVTLNLYGDIISDIAAQVAGSVGLAGSANVGDTCSMFEAIHGSAPMIAGQNIANPSGLLNGAIMMLVHIHQPEIATRVHNAWLATLESGIHTADIYKPGSSKQKVGTKEFADAVIANLGQEPKHLARVEYAKREERPITTHEYTHTPQKKEMVGFDVFLDHKAKDATALGATLSKIESDTLQLSMISNRGTKVWPNGMPETFCTNEWRCRFLSKVKAGVVKHQDLLDLLRKIEAIGFDYVKIESLCNFDGIAGYSLSQGE
ncbi:MAG: NADP-dependent isocitrate dehydrogenase [Candidatus Kapaibacterium sp.]|jgi:isocitrate dehydrogenase